MRGYSPAAYVCCVLFPSQARLSPLLQCKTMQTTLTPYTRTHTAIVCTTIRSSHLSPPPPACVLERQAVPEHLKRLPRPDIMPTIASIASLGSGILSSASGDRLQGSVCRWCAVCLYACVCACTAGRLFWLCRGTTRRAFACTCKCIKAREPCVLANERAHHVLSRRTCALVSLWHS